MHLDAGTRSRIGISRRSNYPQGSVGEAQDGDSYIFGLHAMHQGVRVRADALDRTHQPLQQINGMDRLVHQYAAPIQLPGPAPCSTVIVRLRTPPGDKGVAQDQSAKCLRLHQIMHLDGVRIKAMLAETASFTPVSCCTRNISSMAARLTSMGFSTITFTPARMTWQACSPCIPLGVQTSTTSSCSRANIS